MLLYVVHSILQKEKYRDLVEKVKFHTILKL